MGKGAALIDTPQRCIQAAIEARDYARALDAMIQAFQHEVVGYCITMLGDQASGEETAQNAFLAAYRAMAQFRGASSVRTWLFAIARRQCLKVMTQRRRHQNTLIAVPTSADSLEFLLIEQQEEALWEQRRQRLSQALNRLTKREKDVVMMYYFLGCTYADIANKLWVSETTARRRVHQALRHLKEILLRDTL